MKKGALMLFSVFAMLVSCKCKNAVVKNSEMEKQTTTEVNANTNSNESSSKLQESGAVVEYTANTRGYHLKVKFTPNELTYTNERGALEGTKVALDAAQKAELQQLLKAIDVEKISELKAPTQKRLYDGAAHADLIIIVNGKEYHSAGFDHGEPPAAIEKFIKKLISYTEQN